jgi:hypothetical protein
MILRLPKAMMTNSAPTAKTSVSMTDANDSIAVQIVAQTEAASAAETVVEIDVPAMIVAVIAVVTVAANAADSVVVAAAEAAVVAAAAAVVAAAAVAAVAVVVAAAAAIAVAIDVKHRETAFADR